MKSSSTWRSLTATLGLTTVFLCPPAGAQDDDDWPPPPQPIFREQMDLEEIKTEMLRQLPIMGDPEASRAEQAIALREWLHAFIPVADSGLSLSYLGYDHNREPLSRMLWATEMRIGGYYCGGASEIARQIYLLFGFDAVAYNMGFRGTSSTHVTTIVKLPDPAGGEFWSIQDAYFNFTLRDTTGELMSMDRFYDLLLSDQLEHIIVDDPDLPRTPALYADLIKVPRINRRYHMEAECVRPWDGFEEFLIRWDYRLLHTSMFDYGRQLEARVGRSDPLYVLAVPLGMNNRSRHPDIWERVLAARDRLLAISGTTEEDLTKEISLPPKPLDPIR